MTSSTPSIETPTPCSSVPCDPSSSLWCSDANSLNTAEIDRYNRAMLVQGVGAVSYETMLRTSNVLVVGAGGLGSTCCLFLAAGGVSKLGILDFDTVEITNLHRQVIHTSAQQGIHKAQSAAQACRALNPMIAIETHEVRLEESNALSILSQYNIVVDCTDNIPARYLLSDTAVILGIPLVSGAAVQWDGQMTVYNYGVDGPCYRCLHPIPPPKNTLQSCADVGVMGPIPGTIGSLLALEVQKIALQTGTPMSGRMLHLDGKNNRYLTVELRSRNRQSCEICRLVRKDGVGIDETTMTSANPPFELKELIAYRTCGPLAADLPLKHVRNVQDITSTYLQHCIIIDVRPRPQFAMCRISHNICKDICNVPFGEWPSKWNLETPSKGNDQLKSFLTKHKMPIGGTSTYPPILVVCRRGIMSSHATARLLETNSPLFQDGTSDGVDVAPDVSSMVGGMTAYGKFNPSCPIY